MLDNGPMVRAQREMGFSLAVRIALIVIAILLSAGPAVAQSLNEGEIAIIQPKPVLVQQRVEFIPRFGVTFNDPLISQFHTGGSLYYHISERYHVGPTFEWYDYGSDFGGTTETYDEVITVSSTSPEGAPLTMYAGADFGWVPINGKFALFDALIVYYDIYLTAGLGVVQSLDEIHPAGAVSFGQRTFIPDWLALVLEMRDRIYIEPLPSGNAFTNIVSVSAGFGFFLPTTFDYEVHEERILDWD